MTWGKRLITQSDIEQMRQRPAMYVGNTGQMGVCNLIFGLVEEFVDVSGKANVFITMTLADDDSLVFTCDRMIDTGSSLPLAVAKALSDIFDLSYENEQRNKIKILFRPDKSIFAYDKVDYYRLYNRFKELSQLNDNVRFLLSDGSNRNSIQYHNGLNALLKENMCEFHLEDLQPMNLFFTERNVEVSLSMALGYPADVALSYVNNSRTHGGGSHVKGLYDGVYASFEKYMEAIKGLNIKYLRKDLIDDLNFVISVRTKHPMYGGNTKRKLSDMDVRDAVRDGVQKSLDTILESDRSFFDASSIIQLAAFMYTVKSAIKKDNPNIDWD